ncbi:MAG: fluoride efflux transporter CrcB [Pseudomonadota bacterium]
MTAWLAVAAGGALGALGRYGLSAWLAPVSAGRFPFATLLANVLGCALIGILHVLIVERALVPAVWRELLMIGVLGGFTTFSTFSIDTLGLWQNHQPLLAVVNVAANLVLSLGAAATAMALTRL